MNVGELERILSTLPEDMPVLVSGLHIDRIYRENRGVRARITDKHLCSEGRCVVGYDYENVAHDGYISLYGGVAGFGRDITDEPPAVRLHGRWAKAAKAAVLAGREAVGE